MRQALNIRDVALHRTLHGALGEEEGAMWGPVHVAQCAVTVAVEVEVEVEVRHKVAINGVRG